MEDELFHQILKYIKEIPIEEYNSLLLLKVLELIKENKDLCKVLFCNQRDSKHIKSYFKYCRSNRCNGTI